MDVDDGKWKEAKNFEADFRIISFFRPSKSSKGWTNGKVCEILLAFVNNNQIAPTAIEVLQRRGPYFMVGLFGASWELNLWLVPLRAV